MARKDNPDKPEAPPPTGRAEIGGIVLIAVSSFLLFALFSFEPNDVGANTATPNKDYHNVAGMLGAHVANGCFFLFGIAAYLLAPLLLLWGAVPFVESLAYLRRRWPWAVLLLLCFAGLFDLFPSIFETIRVKINAPWAGGATGHWLNQYVFKRLLGTAFAAVTFGTLYLIGLLYLTDFALLDWARGLLARDSAAGTDGLATSTEELALAKRARELEKEAQRLQDEVEKNNKAKQAKPAPPVAPEKPGVEFGADGQPVPEPRIRDLSVPQAKPADLSAKSKRKDKPAEDWSPGPASPAPDAIVIKAEEVAAATTADILGKAEAPPKKAEVEKPAKPAVIPETEPLVHVADALAAAVAETPKPAEPPPAPAIFDNSGAAPRPRNRPQPKKPKPVTVASVPLIGNYQLPPLDFLQHPDLTVKPTETKEDLMASAQLMKNTLAQFEIEVALGDITKGPTITRYELHPAPGVKLEKISALSNNIAAALKAERINILAPVPGKSSVGIEVPNRVKTKVIMRDLLESDEWKLSKARIPLALGKDVYGTPVIADLADMPHVLIAGSTGSGKSVCINSIVASLLYRFSPDQLRFVMIDPKVVELQQYNALPHLVVPVVTDPKKVILALRWVVNEMEKRYQIFARVGVRNIKSFNDRPKDKPLPPAELELPLSVTKEKVEAGADGFAVQIDEEIVVPRDEDIIIPEKLSYIVVIIDELAICVMRALHISSCSSRPPTWKCASPASRRWPAPPAFTASSPPSARPWTSSPASSRPTFPRASPSRSRKRWTRAPFSTRWARTSCWARATCSTSRPAQRASSARRACSSPTRRSTSAWTSSPSRASPATRWKSTTRCNGRRTASRSPLTPRRAKARTRNSSNSASKSSAASRRPASPSCNAVSRLVMAVPHASWMCWRSAVMSAPARGPSRATF